MRSTYINCRHRLARIPVVQWCYWLWNTLFLQCQSDVHISSSNTLDSKIFLLYSRKNLKLNLLVENQHWHWPLESTYIIWVLAITKQDAWQWIWGWLGNVCVYLGIGIQTCLIRRPSDVVVRSPEQCWAYNSEMRSVVTSWDISPASLIWKWFDNL